MFKDLLGGTSQVGSGGSMHWVNHQQVPVQPFIKSSSWSSNKKVKLDNVQSGLLVVWTRSSSWPVQSPGSRWTKLGRWTRPPGCRWTKMGRQLPGSRWTKLARWTKPPGSWWTKLAKQQPGCRWTKLVKQLPRRKFKPVQSIIELVGR